MCVCVGGGGAKFRHSLPSGKMCYMPCSAREIIAATFAAVISDFLPCQNESLHSAGVFCAFNGSEFAWSLGVTMVWCF